MEELATPLSGVVAKINRAAEHFDHLYREFNDYVVGAEGEGSSHVFLDALETEEDGTVWRVTRLKVLRDPPARLGLILGDGVHNLRSALDHLMAELCELKAGRPVPSPGFPIYANPPSQRARQALRKSLNQVSPDHAAIIEKLQPFRSPGSSDALALGMIATLDNYDKHQFVHPTFATIRATIPPSVALVSSMFGLIQRFPERGTVLKDGDEVMALTSPNPANLALANKIPPRVELAFGHAPISINQILSIHNHVVHVVKLFESSFAGADAAVVPD